MLSRILSSARSIFNPTPQTCTNTESSIDRQITEMVTTRGQSSRPASQEEARLEDCIVVESPRSSRKRTRNANEDGLVDVAEESASPTTVKKQKVLPLRERDDATPNRSTRLVVEIPVSLIASELRSMEKHGEDEMSEEEGGEDNDSAGAKKGFEETEPESPSNDEHLQKLNIQKDAEAEAHESEDKPEAASSAIGETEVMKGVGSAEAPLEISDSESDGESQVLEETAKTSPMQPRTKVSPKMTETAPMSAQPKPKHTRFGSEHPEPGPEFSSAGAEILESDEESSDDDAPEVMGAQDALEIAQSKARDAAKAIKGQEAAIRKKRQERNAKLKEQADAANEKRKDAERAEKIEPSPAELTVKHGGENQKDLGAQDAAGSERIAPPVSINVLKTSKLPELLPDEYLQDDNDRKSLEGQEVEITRTKSKKTKFLDLLDKKPKDRRIGSTTYRVSEVSNKKLAPKSSFHARNTKESWLKGRGPMSGGGVRKVASTSFVKKK